MELDEEEEEEEETGSYTVKKNDEAHVYHFS